ncbi:MAG: aminotransferase DegT [Candidatus Niyogibacteria bacterium CG10_big_fil_rev_8_21_14_0_10_46_36]|uniref:Aminotransferase DegT n=1 Tax=Candidatus Niyogibacteria bacterium CG10_big_fil_rev_8_21_14_0_10_46_36 TaxID=1974726 RepID=A0A2H0TEI8_9BACT|nr:MAG: aminotransferase DegT [Candidatus Niyogibacteria bacterium CG10_big_fil_rev_8_21_14_0_10_46_36]
MKTRYPLAEQVINTEDIDALREWLGTYPRLTKGEETEAFEREWAGHMGSRFAVFVNSGSSANLLAAYAEAYLAGDAGTRNKKVIVPATGWPTSIAPFMQAGFQSLMCGTNKEDFGYDYNQLEDTLKRHSPFYVVLVHTLGVPADMDIIRALQDAYGFCLVLEDACASYGATYRGEPVGSSGSMSSFSFYFGHQLSTIEGGMICTQNKELHDMLMMLRSHGWQKDLMRKDQLALFAKYGPDSFYDPFLFVVPGFNVRATDIQAFLGRRQIQKAKDIFAIRNRNHVLYARSLKTVSRQTWGEEKEPCSIHFCAVAQSREHRRRILEALTRHGIESRVFSAGNLGRHPFWTERYGEFRHPVSDWLYNRGFFLPNNESLTENDIKCICEVVNNVDI